MSLPKTLVEKIISYQTPKEAINLLEDASIIFVVGIAGAGKNTIINRLISRNGYKPIISHTTRQPRINDGIMEQNGREYHFVRPDEISVMLDRREFVEAKVVHGDTVYGTSIVAVQKALEGGNTAINEIDIQGIDEYKSIAPSVKTVFVLPPDYDTWFERLKNRYGQQAIDSEELKKRIASASKELKHALSKDYYEFVVNDDLERAVWAMDEIVKGNISSKKNEEAKAIARELLKRLDS